MIQITPHMRILVAVEAIDFRAGIDGLASLCRQRLEADPFSGSLFVRQPDLGAMTFARATWRIHSSS